MIFYIASFEKEKNLITFGQPDSLSVSYEGFYDLNTNWFIEDQTSTLNSVYNEFIKRGGFAVKCDVEFIKGKIKMLKLLQ